MPCKFINGTLLLLRWFGATACRQSRSETLLPWQRGYEHWQKNRWLAATRIGFFNGLGLLSGGQTKQDVICRMATD